MSDTCEVVTIETENGPVEINKSDFDGKIHKLAGEKSAPKPKAAPKKKAVKKA